MTAIDQHWGDHLVTRMEHHVNAVPFFSGLSDRVRSRSSASRPVFEGTAVTRTSHAFHIHRHALLHSSRSDSYLKVQLEHRHGRVMVT
jgi:hypothetical protein